mgnify:CR=1 FL=1
MEERKPLPAEAKSANGTVAIELQKDQKATPEALPKERPRLQAAHQKAAQEKASQEKTDAIKEDESECEENEKTAVTKRAESKEDEQREDSGDGKKGEEEAFTNVRNILTKYATILACPWM